MAVLSAEDAIAQADWLVRYAADSYADSDRLFHPGVRSHTSAAVTHLRAVVGLLDPANDQRIAGT